MGGWVLVSGQVNMAGLKEKGLLGLRIPRTNPLKGLSKV